MTYGLDESNRRWATLQHTQTSEVSSETSYYM